MRPLVLVATHGRERRYGPFIFQISRVVQELCIRALDVDGDRYEETILFPAAMTGKAFQALLQRGARAQRTALNHRIRARCATATKCHPSK